MEKGEVHKVEIGPLLTSNMFLEGHQIRLEIVGSNFPRFTSNLNTGANNYDEVDWIVTTSEIPHSAHYPTRMVLPVIPE